MKVPELGEFHGVFLMIKKLENEPTYNKNETHHRGIDK